MKDQHGNKVKAYVVPRNWPEFHEVHGLVAAWKLRSWRLTERELGQISGIKGNLTIVATDGNLGVFLDADGMAYLGHVQRKEGGKVLQQGFDGKVLPLGHKEKVAAKRKAKPKTPKQIKRELLNLL